MYFYEDVEFLKYLHEDNVLLSFELCTLISKVFFFFCQ